MKLVKRLKQVLFWTPNYEPQAWPVYKSLVATSRQSAFYEKAAVPDTLEGRFDLISLHVSLVLYRLYQIQAPKARIFAQDLFDVMFEDIDYNLRESGVGDLSMKRRMRKMWDAFNGRRAAYFEALAKNDIQKLLVAVRKNVHAGNPVPAPVNRAWTAYLQALRQVLNSYELNDFLNPQKWENFHAPFKV